MHFGDSFHAIFEDKLNISERNVIECTSFPLDKMCLENNVTLYLKKFSDQKFQILLAASQIVNEVELFAFAYWIPDFIANENLNLLDVLKRFTDRFGCLIRIGEKEGQFIEKSSKEIIGKVESPFQLGEIMEDEQIPCEFVVFYKENAGQINHVETYYSFAINNNMYYVWLYEIETIEIEIPTGWYTFLYNVTKSLNPYGKTKLSILNPANNFEIRNNTLSTNTKTIFDEKKLEIPKVYRKPFQYVINVISNLQPLQKIVIIPKSEKIKCIFCGADSLSQEHIFSKWLRSFFSNKKLSYVANFQTEEIEIESIHSSSLKLKEEDLFGLVTHVVCPVCNNNWMSELEEKSKKLLVDNLGNLKENKNILGLNKGEKEILARWILIKTLLLTIRLNLIPKIPSNTFLLLMSGIIPQNFLVEICDADFYDFEYECSSGVPRIKGFVKLKKMDSKEAFEISKGFFKASILIGKLLFRISFLDESKGLNRLSYIKETSVLYPDNYKLSFETNEQTTSQWKQTEKKLKIKIFNLIGLMLGES